jgi:hypothetical protein
MSPAGTHIAKESIYTGLYKRLLIPVVDLSLRFGMEVAPDGMEKY